MNISDSVCNDLKCAYPGLGVKLGFAFSPCFSFLISSGSLESGPKHGPQEPSVNRTEPGCGLLY